MHVKLIVAKYSLVSPKAAVDGAEEVREDIAGLEMSSDNKHPHHSVANFILTIMYSGIVAQLVPPCGT